MAERVSFIPEVEDESDDDFSLEGSSSKKKSKKSAEKIGAALIDKTAERKFDNPLENLRGIFAEKPEKAAEKTDAETVLKKLSDEALDTTPLAEWRELRPDELAGGEVVIELHETEEPVEPTEVAEATSSDSAELTDEVKDEEDDPTAVPLAASGGSGSSGSGSGHGPSSTGAGHGSTGGSGGGVPPRPPVSSSSYPPTPRRRAASTTSRTFTAPPLAPATGASFNQLLAVQQAADEAWHQGRGRGRGEGLLAGLIVGGGIEHLRHKSREKKMGKKAKAEKQKQEKTFESEKTELTHRATKDRLEYEQKLHAEADAAIIAQTSEASATTKAITAEKAKVDAEKEKAKLIERLNAQAAEQERLDAEDLLKDPEHRIETSAWHAMEVDKSGHIVEDGNIEYGHEYYSERAHETGPKDQLDAKAGSTAVAAAMFSGGSSSQQSVPTQSGGQPGQSARPALQKSVLPPIAGIDTEDADSSSHISAVAIVPWLVVLAVIAVAIIALL